MKRDDWKADSLQQALIRASIKIDKAISGNDYAGAIQTLESYTGRHTYAQSLHNLLAYLYYHEGNFIKAGKHLYFKLNRSEQENECVAAFIKSLGNNPAHLLKNLIYKSNFNLSLLDEYTLQTLNTLLQETIIRYKHIPDFAKNLYEFLQKNVNSGLIHLNI